ncbi:MAG: LysR family transcriptional regulator [Propioniciclava sp.]|uniref:LysR substrate-binding domain-containing protein n=1 Tax=Propioniciclava sp. TaxID=2038686 RepID=UPI0039E2E0F2
MFTLTELQGFVAVAEEGSFRRGAQRLSITQPPLSRHIQKLERSLGVVLFDRGATGARLTPAGRALLGEARAILERASGAQRVAAGAALGESGTLTISFTAVVAFTLLAGLLRSVTSAMPGVQLRLIEAVTRQQVESVTAGDVDVGFARGVQATEVLATRKVHAESLMLATHDAHPLAQLGRAPRLAEIATQPVVTYSPSLAHYLHDVVIAAFIAHDLTPHYVQQVTQVTSALAVVSSGLGVALVPASARYISAPGIRLTPIADCAPDTVQTVAIWRRDNDSPTLARLLRLINQAPRS